MKEVVVESFTMDHTKVTAPFVRRCGKFETPKGDIVSKFDLRFTQPNVEFMTTGAIHAMEHILAGILRQHLDGVIDLSPMGCRTGFYMIVLGDYQEEQIAKVLVSSLEKLQEADSVPAANEIQCGNYRDLSLADAKKYSLWALENLKKKYKL